MSHQAAPSDVIYIIRHGEKPGEPESKHSYRAVDFHGNHDEHSLLPRGWQRSGALAALFDPHQGPLRPGLRVPRKLVSPSYGDKNANTRHRTHQTISVIADRLGIPITADFAKGQEPELAAELTESGGPVLVCWDHARIPDLALALPLAPGTVIPKAWPDDRFDLIWSFTRAASREYSFAQLPQLLLPGDSDAVIDVPG